MFPGPENDSDYGKSETEIDDLIGDNVFHAFVRTRNFNLIKSFKEKNADVNAINSDGLTPYQLAEQLAQLSTQIGCRNIYAQIKKVLIKYGASVEEK